MNVAKFSGVLKTFHQPKIQEALVRLVNQAAQYHQWNHALIDEVILGQYRCDYKADKGINSPAEIVGTLMGLGATQDQAKKADAAIQKKVSLTPTYLTFLVPFFRDNKTGQSEMQIVTTGYNGDLSYALSCNQFKNPLVETLQKTLGGVVMNRLMQTLFNLEATPIFFPEEDDGEAMLT